MRNSRGTIKGFSLIELMIAMALGLFLVGAALNVMLTNRETFRTADELARMQENARTAFEMLARDVRNGGGNPCGTKPWSGPLPGSSLIANALNGAANLWWGDWDGGSLIGYENGVAPAGATPFATIVPANNLVANTDAILVLSTNSEEAFVNARQVADVTTNLRTIETVGHRIFSDDVLMVCDYRSTSIFQVVVNSALPAPPPPPPPQPGAPPPSLLIAPTAGGANPGNATANLGLSVPPAVPPARVFDNGALMAKLYASFWYVGTNGRGGNSLFRVSMTGNPANIRTDEIVDDVLDLEISYLLRTVGPAGPVRQDFVPGNNVPSWVPNAVEQPQAVRITLTLQSRNQVGVDAANQANRTNLQTVVDEVIYLRNRESL